MKRSVTAIIICGLIVGGTLAYFAKRSQPYTTHMGRVVPPEGLVMNPRGKNPGDPENAVRDFRRLYGAMIAYRKLHGKLPELGDLLDCSKPLAPGYQLSKDDFNVPDAEFSDRYDPKAKNASGYAFAYKAPRPDGRPKPDFPKPGERDVWIFSADYVRENQVVHQDRRSDIDFRGVYVVLWSDGKVEKIRSGDMMRSPNGPGAFVNAFPGEAGLPQGTKSLASFYADDDFNRVSIDGNRVSRNK